MAAKKEIKEPNSLQEVIDLDVIKSNIQELIFLLEKEDEKSVFIKNECFKPTFLNDLKEGFENLNKLN